MDSLDLITVNPVVVGGKACIRGLRVTVGMIVGQIGAGRDIDDLLADYPYLQRDAIYGLGKTSEVLAFSPEP